MVSNNARSDQWTARAQSRRMASPVASRGNNNHNQDHRFIREGSHSTSAGKCSTTFVEQRIGGYKDIRMFQWISYTNLYFGRVIINS